MGGTQTPSASHLTKDNHKPSLQDEHTQLGISKTQQM